MSAPTSPRELAAHEVARLVARLTELSATVPVAPTLIDLGGHLERAILAFHMEAIRFRAYTMSRLIKQQADALPADVPAMMEAVTAALEAAGFQTRSVSA